MKIELELKKMFNKQIDSNKLDLFMKYKLGNPMKQIDELIEMAKDITNKYIRRDMKKTFYHELVVNKDKTFKIIGDDIDWMDGYSNHDNFDYLVVEEKLEPGKYKITTKATYFEGQSSHQGSWDIKPGWEVEDTKVKKTKD